MKKIILGMVMVLMGLFCYKKTEAQTYRTYIQVSTELLNNGYVEVPIPNGFVPSFGGNFTVHVFQKSGVAEEIVVYNYQTENDVPPPDKDKCTLKAEAVVENNKVYERCWNPGNECRVKVNTDGNGNMTSYEIICCG